MKYNKAIALSALFTLYTPTTLIATEHEHDQQEAHVHGEATLLVALNDTTLEIELHSPAINIVGFEHEARNKQQTNALEQAVSQLKQADHLFTLPDSAQCSIQSVDVHFPFSDHKTSNEAKTHEDEESHKDFEAHYHFMCRNGEQLDQITVNLFTLFPGTESIEVQSISPHGQHKQALTAKHNIIDL